MALALSLAGVVAEQEPGAAVDLLGVLGLTVEPPVCGFACSLTLETATLGAA